MTKFPEVFTDLVAAFRQDEIRERTGQKGSTIRYVTARTIMNRLDEVLGPENWWDAYVPGEHSVMCTLTIRLPDGSVLSKMDAGGYAGMADEGDDDKSGFSDAFKRAAVKYGVGRYLYRDGVPFYQVGQPAAASPALPAPAPAPVAALPAPTGRDLERVPRNPKRPTAPAPPQRPGHHRAPATGGALYKWAKDYEERTGEGILRFLEGWAKDQDYPPKLVQWSREQVAIGYGVAYGRVTVEVLEGVAHG